MCGDDYVVEVVGCSLVLGVFIDEKDYEVFVVFK